MIKKPFAQITVAEIMEVKLKTPSYMSTGLVEMASNLRKSSNDKKIPENAVNN